MVFPTLSLTKILFATVLLAMMFSAISAAAVAVSAAVGDPVECKYFLCSRLSN